MRKLLLLSTAALAMAASDLEIGATNLELGRFRDAERAYLRALSTLPESDRTEALIGLGAVYLKTGQLSKAERRAQEVLQIRETEHGDVGAAVQNLAVVYQAEHRNAEAKVLFNRAIAMLEGPGLAAARGNLAMILAAEGEIEGAVREAETAVSIWRTVTAPHDSQLAVGLNVLAAIYCKARRWADALDPIREAHGLTVRHLGARNPSLEPILRTYAEVLEHFGQRREAKQMLRHADDIIRESAALNLTGYTVDARVYH